MASNPITSGGIVPIDMDLLVRKVSTLSPPSTDSQSTTSSSETPRTTRVRFDTTPPRVFGGSDPDNDLDTPPVNNNNNNNNGDKLGEEGGVVGHPGVDDGVHDIIHLDDDVQVKGGEVSLNIMVALLDRAEEMRELVRTNAPFFRQIRSILQGYDYNTLGTPLSPSPLSPLREVMGFGPAEESGSPGDAYDSFREVLFTPRAEMPDMIWIAELGHYLHQVPAIWSKFEDMVGYDPCIWETQQPHSVLDAETGSRNHHYGNNADDGDDDYDEDGDDDDDDDDDDDAGHGAPNFGWRSSTKNPRQRSQRTDFHHADTAFPNGWSLELPPDSPPLTQLSPPTSTGLAASRGGCARPIPSLHTPPPPLQFNGKGHRPTLADSPPNTTESVHTDFNTKPPSFRRASVQMGGDHPAIDGGDEKWRASRYDITSDYSNRVSSPPPSASSTTTPSGSDAKSEFIISGEANDASPMTPRRPSQGSIPPLLADLVALRNYPGAMANLLNTYQPFFDELGHRLRLQCMKHPPMPNHSALRGDYGPSRSSGRRPSSTGRSLASSSHNSISVGGISSNSNSSGLGGNAMLVAEGGGDTECEQLCESSADAQVGQLKRLLVSPPNEIPNGPYYEYINDTIGAWPDLMSQFADMVNCERERLCWDGSATDHRRVY
ncbi:hypothetical protein BJ085DRAFT_35828 [Dimargaris cristalligena]|uniref:Uncharacterized protein n=1 Tax=Dimargaris cristalligena TaxID=215637 RepID=A0A4P9ZTD9_9FUNG|nr:hypothetical protein BJ085DRAFT_35828 [Dimargaris cristalligena]|eukprot:RKP36101.1 hypothetical protein BJ085DRAFT_35828 [Dimargaris cristalligena]